MEPWKTAIVDAGPTHIRVRGHDVLDLMRQSTFTDLIYLLHHDRLPTPAERRLIDAILIGVADHGPGAPSCAAARRPGRAQLSVDGRQAVVHRRPCRGTERRGTRGVLAREADADQVRRRLRRQADHRECVADERTDTYGCSSGARPNDYARGTSHR